MEYLLALDRLLFFRINHLPHTSVTDGIAQLFSLAGSIGAVWLVIAGYMYARQKRGNHRFFIPVAATLLSCFIFVEGLVKFIVARPRPDIADGAVVIGWAQWHSFPSSHAAVSWAMAYIMSKYAPRARFLWYILAGLISLSRIYLGAHYPLDVLAGGVIGWGIAGMSYAYFSPRRQTGNTSEKKAGRRITS